MSNLRSFAEYRGNISLLHLKNLQHLFYLTNVLCTTNVLFVLQVLRVANFYGMIDIIFHIFLFAHTYLRYKIIYVQQIEKLISKEKADEATKIF